MWYRANTAVIEKVIVVWSHDKYKLITPSFIHGGYLCRRVCYTIFFRRDRNTRFNVCVIRISVIR